MAAVYVRCLSPSDDDKKRRRFSKISVSKEEEASIGKAYEPPFPERKHQVVGYCKGLYCLEFENGETLLWNPSKKEYKFLPPTELKTPRCPSPTCPILDCSVRTVSGVRGLGFDPKSRDYKVVRHAENFYSHCIDCFSTKQVEVYSLKDDCWREIGNEGDEYYILDEYATYLNGSCHWIAHTSAYPGYLIISLDLSTYEFSRIDVPIPGRGWICFADSGAILTDYQSSLAFIVHKWGCRQGETYKTMSCWVRGPYGWVETMNNFKFDGEKPLGFCGDVLMLESKDGELMSYDSHQKLVKIDGIYDYSLCLCISPFMKSNVHLAGKGKEWSIIPHKRKRKGKESKRKGDGEKV